MWRRLRYRHQKIKLLLKIKCCVSFHRIFVSFPFHRNFISLSFVSFQTFFRFYRSVSFRSFRITNLGNFWQSWLLSSVWFDCLCVFFFFMWGDYIQTEKTTTKVQYWINRSKPQKQSFGYGIGNGCFELPLTASSNKNLSKFTVSSRMKMGNSVERVFCRISTNFSCDSWWEAVHNHLWYHRMLRNTKQVCTEKKLIFCFYFLR
jgi:hypothetical protein